MASRGTDVLLRESRRDLPVMPSLHGIGRKRRAWPSAKGFRSSTSGSRYAAPSYGSHRTVTLQQLLDVTLPAASIALTQNWYVPRLKPPYAVWVALTHDDQPASLPSSFH